MDEETNSPDPCPRCRSTSYVRKLSLDVGGTPVTVCNVCAPHKVVVPLEVQQDNMLITTGMFKATLDWRKKNVIVASEQRWAQPSRARKLWNWARHLWPTTATPQA